MVMRVRNALVVAGVSVMVLSGTYAAGQMSDGYVPARDTVAPRTKTVSVVREIVPASCIKALAWADRYIESSLDLSKEQTRVLKVVVNHTELPKTHRITDLTDVMLLALDRYETQQGSCVSDV
jgi:hypothetical protein